MLEKDLLLKRDVECTSIGKVFRLVIITIIRSKSIVLISTCGAIVSTVSLSIFFRMIKAT